MSDDTLPQTGIGDDAVPETRVGGGAVPQTRAGGDAVPEARAGDDAVPEARAGEGVLPRDGVSGGATGICEVVITAADPEWLAGFTRRLIEDRLAACGQQIAAIRSLYRWDGAIQDEPEARVALHTRIGLVGRIIERADAEHPYDVPCVLALPILAANPAYVAWVHEETASA